MARSAHPDPATAAVPLISGRTLAEVRRYDLMKLAVAVLLLLNWLYLCRAPDLHGAGATTSAAGAGGVAIGGPPSAGTLPAGGTATGATATGSSATAGPASGASASGASASGATASGATASGATAVELDRPPPAAAGPGVPAALALYFDTARADLPGDASGQLAPLVAWLKANPSARVGISGYHDRHGDAAFNAELAHNRARAARDALLAAGVSREQLLMVRPQETTGGPDDRRARRVDVYAARP